MKNTILFLTLFLCLNNQTYAAETVYDSDGDSERGGPTSVSVVSIDHENKYTNMADHELIMMSVSPDATDEEKYRCHQEILIRRQAIVSGRIERAQRDIDRYNEAKEGDVLVSRRSLQRLKRKADAASDSLSSLH